MELIQCISILKKETRLFWSIVLACVLLSVVWQQAQAPRYEATQLLNVGRTGVQATADYTYDGFYRLQADERFADTAVRWLGSSRVVEDIYREAGLDPADVFQASRLSSQMIEARYTADRERNLTLLAQAVPVVLNRYAASLNREFREPNWFVIVASDPVLEDARVPFLPVLAGALAVGLFLAFWTVLLKHYLTENRQPTTNNQQQK